MSIIDDVRSVTKVIQQIDNVELYRKILDLQAEIMNLVDENRGLKEEIVSLQDAIKTKESLQFQHNSYWTKNPDGSRRDGPFCSKCWDKDKQTVRMLTMGNSQFHQCPSCKTPVNTSGQPADTGIVTAGRRMTPGSSW